MAKGQKPSKYHDDIPRMTRKACEMGATDQDLADLFGVHRDTIFAWHEQYPAFAAARAEAKEALDARVEHSLFQRAVGYSHADTDIRVADGVVVQTPMTKHYPPDVVAGIFWLKNRRPDRWRAQPDDGSSGDDDVTPPRKVIIEIQSGPAAQPHSTAG